jgi:hypothetical protein
MAESEFYKPFRKVWRFPRFKEFVVSVLEVASA